MKKAFVTWLKEQKDRDDPVGDLSRDLLSDKKFKAPAWQYGKDYVYLYDHMLLSFACEDAMIALKQAYKEYLKSIGGFVKGKWSLIPDNKTLLFKSDSYTYEVDLERDDVFQWEKHLLETKRSVMSKSDINDMVTLWNRAVPSMCCF